MTTRAPAVLKSILPFSKLIIWKSSYVYLDSYMQICDKGGTLCPPPLVLIGLRFCKTSSFLMVIITTTQTGGKYCQVRATFSTTFHLHNAKQIRPNIITRKTIFIFIQTSYSSCNQYPNVHLHLNLCHFDQQIKP